MCAIYNSVLCTNDTVILKWRHLVKYQHVWAGENRSKWLIQFNDLDELLEGITEEIIKAIRISIADEKVKRVDYCIEIEIEKNGGVTNV